MLAHDWFLLLILENLSLSVLLIKNVLFASHFLSELFLTIGIHENMTLMVSCLIH